jgi:hypothetical protein
MPTECQHKPSSHNWPLVLPDYNVYGISIRSDAPLPYPHSEELPLCRIELRNYNGPSATCAREQLTIEKNTFSAFEFGSRPDGTIYVGFPGVGETFVSADGRSIACYRSSVRFLESFDVYLLTQALSFALVKNGLEPLHATAVAIEGRAVVFLGDCGFGKSTLAAALLQAGHRLLTDDLLVFRPAGNGLLAYPGPPRLKLLPEMARRFLGESTTSFPMNPYTHKLIIPLEQSQICSQALPVSAIYVLTPPEAAAACKEMVIAPVTERDAFVTLLASAFNSRIADSSRLQRQFHAVRLIANALPINKITYPREIDYIPQVLQRITSDVRTRKLRATTCQA